MGLIARDLKQPARWLVRVRAIWSLTLAANAVAPGLLDRYLGKTGFASQQTKQKQPPDAPANLWEPADGPDGKDFGTHGIFDSKATTTAPQLWASQHHGLLAAAAGGVLAGATALLLGRRR